MKTVIEQIDQLTITNNPIGLILIGPPCSGKSTFSKHLISESSSWNIASTDAIIQEEAEILGISYNQHFKFSNFKQIEIQMWLNIEDFKLDGKNIIFDQTHCNLKSRKTKIDWCIKNGYYPIAVVAATSLEEIFIRNETRSAETEKFIPLSVIDHMYNSLQDNPPKLTEGFKDIFIL